MTIARSAALLGFAVLCSCGQMGTSAATSPTDAATVVAEPAAVASPAPSAVPREAPSDGLGANAAMQTAPSSTATINGNVIASIKSELVGVGKLDGQAITDVTERDKCATAFATAGGPVVVHWAKVGNIAGRVDHGTASIPIDDGTGTHTFTMPETPTFRRVNGSFGLLADNCQG